MTHEDSLTHIVNLALGRREQGLVTRTFDLMEAADEMIEQWQKHYPAHQAILYDCFMLGMPTLEPIRTNDQLWVHHFEELLERVISDASLAPATDAELVCILADVAKIVPPHAGKFTLYWQLFQKIFPAKAAQIAEETTLHEYVPYPGWIEEQLTEVRRKYSVERHQPSPERWHRLQARHASQSPRQMPLF